MKKVITAINSPQLNEELKKEKNFEIIGKDIQYKEAILEILEKNSDIDLIIINEKIPGEIKLEILIKRIKLINEKIKIIFILEKENNELEKILIKNNIIDIYYNNKINLKELIKIINKKEINMEEEIIKLKKIIEEKNINYEKMEEEYIEKNGRSRKEGFQFLKENLVRAKNEIQTRIKRKKRKERCRNMSTKMITFSGNYKSGKTTLALIISQYLTDKNYKVLLIDGDLEKQDLSFILKKEGNGVFKNFQNRKRKNYFGNEKSYRTRNYKKDFYKKRNNAPKEKYKPINRNKKELKRNNFFKNKKIKNNKLIKKEYYLINKNKRLINRKNKIYFYKIMNNIEKYKKKINKNLDLFYGLKELLENKNLQNEKKIDSIIFYFLQEIKSKYDFIIIDLSKSNFKEINKVFLNHSHLNFLFLESNLLGIKEMQDIYRRYKEEWKISPKSLHIVQNKKNILSVNKRLVAKILSHRNKIFEIKENKFYYFCINHFYKRKILLKNKTIRLDLNKIINKIIYK